MKPLTRLLLLLALSFPLVAAARRPAGAASTPAVVRRTLPNGLRVLVRPRRTAPVVTTMMWYRVGSRDELPGATGIAHFLEHLLFKGTRKLPKGAIDRITYRNGGSNNAFTFLDYTAYEFNLPRRSWRVALEIEADRMRNCVFDRGEFEAERRVVIEERRASEDDPEQQLGEQVNALSFLAHPYRNPVIGWMADLERLTRDEVYAFYRKHYVPGNATLVITGDIEPEEAVAAARRAFAGVPALPVPSRRVVREPPALGSRRVTLSLPTGVGRLAAVFRLPPRKHPDLYAARILVYALSQGKLSRLYRRLVETDRGVASVDGYLGVYRDASQLGFFVNAREGASLERVEAALWEELERLSQEPLEEPALTRARNQFLADWAAETETANDLASVLGEADALGGHEYLDSLPRRIQAVTAADVRRVARTYLRRELACVGHLLPRAGKAEGGAARAAATSGPAASRPAAYRAGRSPARSHEPAKPARRGSPPVAAGFPPLRPLERVLPNGLRLVLLENRELPLVTLSARIAAGSLDEPDAEAGLAALTARTLREGTRALDHAAINELLEDTGSSLQTSVGRAGTYLTLSALGRHLSRLLPLYAETLRSPSFPPERVTQERERLLVELREAADDAATVARQHFDALIYGEHPAHRPVTGTEATVRTLDHAAASRFHGRHYRPDQVTLVAVGDFRAADLLARLESLLGDWAAGAPSLPRTLPPLRRQSTPRSRAVTMERAQAQVLLGHLGIRRTDPDYATLRVLDTLLGEGVGGGFTARIPYQLRDVQGLAYSVGSSITRSADQEPGVFLAALGTDPDRTGEAVAALLREIRRIRASPVSRSELQEAVAYLANSYVFEFQTNAQLASYLHLVRQHGLGDDYRVRYPVALRRVTREDVLRAARKHLDPDRFTLVTVGPRPEVRRKQ